MVQVKNQGYLRKVNKLSIIHLLRKRTQSYSDLARELKLSNTAIGKIVDDLLEQKLVARDCDVRGRGGINLRICNEINYIIAINLSGWKVEICASDYLGNVLKKVEEYNITALHHDDIENILFLVRELRTCDEVRGRVLKCISIASPGKIDRETGKFVLNPRFKGFEDVSLTDIFTKEFQCKTVIENDINLALLGESMFGKNLEKKNNAIMLHVDVGTGAALLINGKIFAGDNGFAGEIGFYKINSFLDDDSNIANLSYANYFDSLSLFSMVSIVRRDYVQHKDSMITRYVKQNELTASDISIQLIADAYKQNDAFCRGIVNSIARTIGVVVRNLVDFLDIETVIINGEVIDFGEDFLKTISDSSNGVNALYPSLKKESIIMGAINQGIDTAIREQL